jgi:hypothetical protein
MTSNADLLRQLLVILSPDANQATEPAQTKPQLRPVLVTTAHRGVFFGWTADTSGSTIVLEKCRMAVYWSKAMKGVLGLASVGPDADCRISPAATFELRDVTGVADCTAEAVARWDEFPWSE